MKFGFFSSFLSVRIKDSSFGESESYNSTRHLHFCHRNIDDTSNNNNEIKNVPAIEKIVLFGKKKLYNVY